MSKIIQGRPGAFDYKTVDTRSVKGIEEAERLLDAGWRIIRSGLFLVQFERAKAMKKNPRRRAKRNPMRKIRSMARRATPQAKRAFAAGKRLQKYGRGGRSHALEKFQPPSMRDFYQMQVRQGAGWLTLAAFPKGDIGKARATEYGKLYARRFPKKTFRVFWPDEKGSSSRMRKNPAARDDRARGASQEVTRAASLFEAFTGHRADSGEKVAMPPAPKTALAIGPVLLIGYSTIRDGKRENYVHRFASHARPLLAASSDGRSVFMLGGAYTFTDRGIVDAQRQRR